MNFIDGIHVKLSSFATKVFVTNLHKKSVVLAATTVSRSDVMIRRFFHFHSNIFLHTCWNSSPKNSIIISVLSHFLLLFPSTMPHCHAYDDWCSWKGTRRSTRRWRRPWSIEWGVPSPYYELNLARCHFTSQYTKWCCLGGWLLFVFVCISSAVEHFSVLLLLFEAISKTGGLSPLSIFFFSHCFKQWFYYRG